MISSEEVTMIDRRSMELAAHLLAKAQSTEFDAEAVALVEKSYVLLAKVITAFDDAAEPTTSGVRRRERRHLRDRRAARRFGIFGAPSRNADPAVTYRQVAEDLQPKAKGHFNFKA
jgi:hypothetical protein